ncbi:hypothetical protein V6N11_027009 [Hibiscus sabdariffa]|uniref:EF-hand domain-containing protein n=1 Tax=Hibiscus sabdariffa TaxID=183260 RepID=A0ABR2PFM4_9ROSI
MGKYQPGIYMSCSMRWLHLPVYLLSLPSNRYLNGTRYHNKLTKQTAILVLISHFTPHAKILETTQIDKIVADVFSTTHADDKKTVKEDEFKKLLTEILWTIMLQLEDNPITVSSSSVVHEPLESSSSILQP